jgi:hypothetical protein
MSVERRHLDTYLELFCHRRDIFAQQTAAGGYVLRRAAVDEALVRAHLAGQVTAGWYALRPDDTVRWVVLDADREDGLVVLQDAWRRLDSRGISSYLEASRGGRAHLWLFAEPIAARVARRLILSILPQLEGVEVFPKSDRLAAGSRVGTLVRGPLGIHRRTGQRYPFVEADTLRPVSTSVAGTLDYLAAATRVTANQAAEQLALLLEERIHPALPVKHAEPESVPSADTPEAGRSTIARLKERIGDLYGFVSQFIELDAAGRGHCPFHPPDHHPSFVVNRQGGYWIDFHVVDPRTGRYAGGDAIEFYRRLHGLSYKDAVRELAQRYLDPPGRPQTG